MFVDSSFWLGFVNQEDSLYTKAVSFSQSEEFLQAILFTSNYVIDETLTRLKNKVGAKAAFSFFESLQRKIKQRNLTLLFAAEESFNRTYRIFKNNPSPKSFSFTDATIMALMRIHQIKNLLTFDQDFRKIKPKVKILP